MLDEGVGGGFGPGGGGGVGEEGLAGRRDGETAGGGLGEEGAGLAGVVEEGLRKAAATGEEKQEEQGGAHGGSYSMGGVGVV